MKRPCPASGRKVAGEWSPKGRDLATRIECPVCRWRFMVDTVGTSEDRSRPYGVLPEHMAGKEAAA